MVVRRSVLTLISCLRSSTYFVKEVLKDVKDASTEGIRSGHLPDICSLFVESHNYGDTSFGTDSNTVTVFDFNPLTDIHMVASIHKNFWRRRWAHH